MSEQREVVAVARGTFCECGGLMNAVGGNLLCYPPRQEMECPFCGETTIVLAREASTTIEFKSRYSDKVTAVMDRGVTNNE